MMEAKLFLKDRLQELADKFENVTLSYFFDNSYSQHVVVVTPANMYSDDVFAKEQVNLELEFINNFPYESLYFVETGNVELTASFEFECLSTQKSYVVSNELVEIAASKLLVNVPVIKVNLLNSFNAQENLVNSFKISTSDIEELLLQSSDVIEYGEENSYAMAA